MKLYYHKTDGSAEYLCSDYILCDNGHKEGKFPSHYVVRIDGDIKKDAELMHDMQLTEKERHFIVETLSAIFSGKARIGSKHYSVSLDAIEIKNLIYTLKRH